MDFTYDEEQQALREAVRGLVGKAYSDFENRRRAVADDPGYSEKVWQQLAEMEADERDSCSLSEALSELCMPARF